MKINLIFLFLILGYLYSSKAQTLIIKGKIKCQNLNDNSTKGAENIVIVPTFQPSRSTVSASFPLGYFEFNTGIPISKLQDKTITLHAISGCSNCKEATKRIFITEDIDRKNKADNKQYVTIKEWMLKSNCKKAELLPMAADSVMNAVVMQPDLDLNKMTFASALTGTPALLNFLTTLTTVVGGTGFPTGKFDINQLGDGKINYGDFLKSSSLYHTTNTGFNYSPSRDMSEAAIWNPSAMTFSRKSNNISLLTNFKNNAKLTGFARLSKNISLGIGFIYNKQDEFRNVQFKQNQNTRWEDSLHMKQTQYQASLSTGIRIHRTISLGASIKLIGQEFNIPNFATVENSGKWSFTDSAIIRRKVDADISASYKPSSSFQLGINIMNILGSENYYDAFKPKQADSFLQSNRSLGLGLVYKYQRWHVGTDILLTQDGFYDASLGVNYVPFNNALISLGMAAKQLSYSLAFRLKNFRIAYINDNGWMVNEQRQGKSTILDGRIFGGFVFDFD
ncbi:MAG TPA: hypothetical protein PLU17_05670 [Chitinophagaceae bacterium]|nr:hypothetical protein [Chitinophagaceae bacterium]